MTKCYYFVAEWIDNKGTVQKLSAIQYKVGVDYFTLKEDIEYVEKKHNLPHPSVIITNVIEITKEEAEKYLEWI